MTIAEITARGDLLLRPIVSKLPADIVSAIYSSGRKYFLKQLVKEEPKKISISGTYKKKLWDLEFQSPLFNAAGMFKDGAGYRLSALQGAGAWIAGTVTPKPRKGNRKDNINHPFIPYSFSGSASNWMGLPNDGYEKIAKKLSSIEKISGCPIGISISTDPEGAGDKILKELIEGFQLFDKSGVDFIELNESCPNVPGHADADPFESMSRRLEYLNNHYLKNRVRNLPVIVKLSVDTDKSLLPGIIELLINLDFDGINLGNTSTMYDEYLPIIDENDVKNYEYFTKNFGGGLSGRIIKEKSLSIASEAVNLVKSSQLNKEFHVIRTGGIESVNDIKDSEEAGISLNQWFTGYFDSFSTNGHKLYRNIFI